MQTSNYYVTQHRPYIKIDINRHKSHLYMLSLAALRGN